jgi:hypothetical protein
MIGINLVGDRTQEGMRLVWRVGSPWLWSWSRVFPASSNAQAPARRALPTLIATRALGTRRAG